MLAYQAAMAPVVAELSVDDDAPLLHQLQSLIEAFGLLRKEVKGLHAKAKEKEKEKVAAPTRQLITHRVSCGTHHSSLMRWRSHRPPHLGNLPLVTCHLTFATHHLSLITDRQKPPPTPLISTEELETLKKAVTETAEQRSQMQMQPTSPGACVTLMLTSRGPHMLTSRGPHAIIVWQGEL